MNCTNCNTSLEDNAVFCANCGEKVVHQASPNFNNDAAVGPTFNNAGGGTAAVQEKVKANLNVIIPIALVALVLIGAFMLFSGGGKPETVVSNFFKSIDKVDPDMMLTQDGNKALCFKKGDPTASVLVRIIGFKKEIGRAHV